MMEILYIFLGSILVLSCIYLLGTLLLYPYRYFFTDSRPFILLSHKVFWGTLGIISIYSLATTYFQSINIVFLLIYIATVILTVVKNKSNLHTYSHFFNDTKYLLYFLPIFCIAVLIGLFRYHYFYDNYPFNHTDNTFYLQLSRIMPLTHLENPMPWNILVSQNPENLLLIPYHYGNLWLASFCIYTCSFLLPMVTYYFVVTPVMILLTSIILTGIISSLFPTNYKSLKISEKYSLRGEYLFLIFSPVLGFLFAMYWGYTPKIPLGFIHTVSIEHKNFNFIFPLAYAIMCYSEDKKLLSFGVFSSIFVLDFVFVPYAVIACGIFSLYFLIYKHKSAMSFTIVLAVLCVYISLFYTIKGALFFFNTQKNNIDVFSIRYFWEMGKIIGNSFFRHVLTSFTFYIAVIITIRHRKFIDTKLLHFTLFILGIVISSIIVTGACHFHPEYWQFLRAINPSTSLFLLVFFCIAYGNINFIPKKIYFVLLSVVLLQAMLAIASQSTGKPDKSMNISKITLDSISRFIGEEDRDSCIVIANFVKDINHKLGVVYGAYNFSGYLKQDIAFIEINIPDTIPSHLEDHQVNLMNISPFYQYMQDKKKAGNFTGIEKAQIQFLKEKEINIVLLDAKTSAEVFTKYVIDSLVFNQGGYYKFYKLKF